MRPAVEIVHADLRPPDGASDAARAALRRVARTLIDAAYDRRIAWSPDVRRHAQRVGREMLRQAEEGGRP